MRIALITTVFNEEKNIASVLSRVPIGVDRIVIDDGSTDRTISIALEHGAMVVRHPVNLGQGAAVITGFRACLLRDYDVVVHVDGDGQHNPEELDSFVRKMEETGADVVIGSRILGTDYKNAPFLRKTFLPYYTWLINKLSGYRMTDSMSGFRAYRVSSLRRVEHVFEEIIEPQYLAAELCLRLAREGFTVEEVPIQMAARSSGSSYKGLVRYGWGVLRAISKTTLARKGK